jgi:phosphate transport system protein
MAKNFHKELEKIKKMILSLGAMVEERVRWASQAIEARDAELAERIIRSDYEVDEMEVEIEEECLKVMALHQPVAIDLRFLITVIKINNDLERIADEAVNIAERVATIAKQSTSKHFFDYTDMAEKVELMLKTSLDALVNMDEDRAFKVLVLDDAVDEIHREAYRFIRELMKTETDQVVYLLNLYLISRHLERIADHTTNISEEVIYLIEGEIVRHGSYA